MSGSQEAFLRSGGPMQAVLQAKWDSGELNPDYVYREYPRMLRRSLGMRKETRSTEVIRAGRVEIVTWEDEHEVFDEIIVQSEQEEERVVAGGKTEAQVEEERQSLLGQARVRGLAVDPSWGIVRLQRELGAAPTSEVVEVLRAKVADLEEKVALRKRIAELEAEVAGGRTPAPVPARGLHITAATSAADEDADGIRAQLAALGVRVDLRWGMQRLRDELEEATKPG